jgi:hypothetical protein
MVCVEVNLSLYGYASLKEPLCKLKVANCEGILLIKKKKKKLWGNPWIYYLSTWISFKNLKGSQRPTFYLIAVANVGKLLWWFLVSSFLQFWLYFCWKDISCASYLSGKCRMNLLLGQPISHTHTNSTIFNCITFRCNIIKSLLDGNIWGVTEWKEMEGTHYTLVWEFFQRK